MARPDPDILVLPGVPPVEVVLRRSARARRYTLRVSQLDGRVTLTLPTRAGLEGAETFLADRAEWIRGHLARHPAAEQVRIGGAVPVEGVMLPVQAGSGRGPRLFADRIEVPEGGVAATGRRVQALLRELARGRLTDASDRYAAALGRGYGRITLRDTRSRWGSCSSEGNLMYSWRLIMAPAEVLDYVAAHEAVHLVEMNHSADFWALVARLCPDYARHRDWLRVNGSELHRLRFGD